MFRTLAHFEPKASSKACGTRKDDRAYSEPGIVSLFKHFQGYYGALDPQSSGPVL